MITPNPDRYPEVHRLTTLAEHKDFAVAFLSWLLDTGRNEHGQPGKGYVLTRQNGDDLQPVQADLEELAHEFFGIDACRLAEERKAILEELEERRTRNRGNFNR